MRTGARPSQAVAELPPSRSRLSIAISPRSRRFPSGYTVSRSGPGPAARRSKQTVLMCLLLLLKFCLGRELTLIIAPRAADRPIPASAGLRGTSGRGIKRRRNSTSRCKSKTYRVYQRATLLGARPGGSTGVLASIAPPGTARAGQWGTARRLRAGAAPCSSAAAAPRASGAALCGFLPPLSYLFVLFLLLSFFRGLYGTPQAHTARSLPSPPAPLRSARFFREDKSADRARRC